MGICVLCQSLSGADVNM